MKTERENVENKLSEKIDIIRNDINKIKMCKSNLQLEIQKMKLEKQKLEFINETLIKKNDNLREKVKEEIIKKNLLNEKNDNLRKMIKEETSKQAKYLYLK